MKERPKPKPELCRLTDGTPVTTRAEWELRRAELLRELSEEEYGITPPPPDAVKGEVTKVVTACVQAGRARSS